MYYTRTLAAPLNNDSQAPERRRPSTTAKDSVSLKNSVLL